MSKLVSKLKSIRQLSGKKIKIIFPKKKFDSKIYKNINNKINKKTLFFL